MATASKAKAAASGNGAAADAAQAEGSNEEHTIEFMGMDITLPPKLRESIIWRAGILREGDFQGNARLVEAVIGSEQFQRVLDHLDEEGVFADPDAEQSPMTDLLNDALAAYGLSAGESEASTDS